MSATLRESATRCGSHCWWERRLFELFGGAAPAATGGDVAVALDRLSMHAAWRAAQWWDRLPVLAGIDRDALVAPPPGAAGVVLPGGDDVATLAVAARVLLPRRLAAYRRHRHDTAPAADGPVLRTLAQVAADAAADRDAVEDLLMAALVDAGAARSAAAAVEEADRSAGSLA